MYIAIPMLLVLIAYGLVDGPGKSRRVDFDNRCKQKSQTAETWQVHDRGRACVDGDKVLFFEKY